MSNQKMTPFFMFTGQAEEAMNFYTSVFDQSAIHNVFHHENGTVLHATFELKGQQFMAIDNSPEFKHEFTPAMSVFVTCDTEEEIDRVFEQFVQDGAALMPLAATPFSEKFAWVQDKYGVSWQLNLAKNEM